MQFSEPLSFPRPLPTLRPQAESSPETEISNPVRYVFYYSFVLLLSSLLCAFVPLWLIFFSRSSFSSLCSLRLCGDLLPLLLPLTYPDIPRGMYAQYGSSAM